jgi:hypothetical protein
MKSLIAASLFVGALQAAEPVMAQAPHQASGMSPSATLHQNMRKLWTDHVVWTREYIVAARA